MELIYLQNILTDLRLRFDAKYSSNTFELKRKLLVLDHMEKSLIRKKVLDFDYNVGALNVLKVLKETSVLNITDFLKHKENEEEVQGIIADVLDCESVQELLVEVILCSTSSALIDSQFHECFRQYLLDIIDRPELIRNEFISRIEQQLPQGVYKDLIVLRFIDELMQHQLNIKHELNQVFSLQKDWNHKFTEEKFQLLIRILRHVSINHSASIIQLLLTKFQADCNFNWFFFLLILSNVSSDAINQLKKFLKSLFDKFQDTKNVDLLFVMLIVARQLFHYTSGSDTTYKSWLKLTIGEMHYQLKSQVKFIGTIESLQALIFHETDLSVLEIHAQTSIASPRGANHIVLEYKHLLKTKMASTGCETVMDLT